MNQPINPKTELVKMEEKDGTITVWASLGATVNLGNFENNKIDFGVSGIPIESSPEFIAEKMQMATMTIHEVVDKLADEMTKRLREDYGR